MATYPSMSRVWIVTERSPPSLRDLIQISPAHPWLQRHLVSRQHSC